MSKVIAGGIFLVNKENMLLICHPTNHAPNVWSIPKGKVEKGEELIDGAIRETHEETNIDLANASNIVSLGSFNYSHGKKMLHGFLVYEPLEPSIDFNSFDIKCNSKVKPDRGDFYEMDDFKWVTFDEARTLIHETQASCLDNILKVINEYDRLTWR